MKNPHIRTLPSHRPVGGLEPLRLYMKRIKREARVWLRGKGPQPKTFPLEFWRMEAFRFIVAPFIK